MPKYTLGEVALHNKNEDCWIIYDDKVYDVSHFEHPGGAEAIKRNAGKDATKAMDEVKAHIAHKDGFKGLLKKHKIGHVQHKFSAEDIALHNKKDDCWVIVKGKVYDVSHFDHPGGANAILGHGGEDVTEILFGDNAVEAHAEHINEIKAILKTCKIGKVKKC